MRIFSSGALLLTLVSGLPLNAETWDESGSSVQVQSPDADDETLVLRRLRRWVCVSRSIYPPYRGFEGYSHYFWEGRGEEYEAYRNAILMAGNRCSRVTSGDCQIDPERDCRLE